MDYEIHCNTILANLSIQHISYPQLVQRPLNNYKFVCFHCIFLVSFKFLHCFPKWATKVSTCHPYPKKFPKMCTCIQFLTLSSKYFFSTLVLLSSPILFILSLPMFFYRILIKYAAKVFRKDLGKMFPTRGHLFAVDNINLAPKCNLVICLVLEGAIEIDVLKSVLKQRLLNSLPKDSEGNERYQELFQYLENWAGYYFWKSDESFNEENHISSLPNSKQHTEEDLKTLGKDFVGRKWPLKRPMWNIVVVPNYNPASQKVPGPHTAILLSFHHSMADGYSLLYYIVNGICQKKDIVNVVPNYIKRSWPIMLLYYLTFPFRASWEGAGIIVNCLKTYAIRADEPYDKFVLDGPEGTNLNVENSASLPISLIKEIKSHYNTSFAAVQFSVIAGALREFHLQKGMVLPNAMPCMSVVPFPGHKLYKFRNHMGAVVVNLPTNEPDPVKRLQLSQSDYHRCKTSTLPILSFYALGLLGWFVSPIARILSQAHMLPTGISSFPGGLEHISLLDCRNIDVYVFAGMLAGNAGVCFMALSYVDNFRIMITGKPSIFSQRDLNILTGLVEKNFKNLHERIKSEQLEV